tara:strand:- start:637 stop:1041 length:405 start_codon:yes stop_codon:yes gene_type:complete
MSNINTEGLPPEMQARIAEIIEKAKSNAIQPVGSVGMQAPAFHPGAQQGLVNPGALVAAPAPAPPTRPPSLMDHIIALRQEVADMRQQVHASGQVTEAVGNAVGQMYQMFQQQTEPTSYSSNFQEAQPSQVDDY